MALIVLMLGIGGCRTAALVEQHEGTAVAQASLRLTPSGVLVDEEREISPFTDVRIVGLDGRVTVGGDHGVVVHGDRSRVDGVRANVREDRLTIERDAGWIRGRDPLEGVTVTVSLPDLVGIHASSGAIVSVDRLSGGPLQAQASSAAELTLSGEADSATLTSSSGATLNASQLRATDVDVTASSGAELRLRASGAVGGRASSGASICYMGDPQQVVVETSSGGEIDACDP